MKILSETEQVFVNMDCEWEDHELDLLMEYAEENMPEEEKQKMMISWAFTDILVNQIKRLESDQFFDDDDSNFQLELEFEVEPSNE